MFVSTCLRMKNTYVHWLYRTDTSINIMAKNWSFQSSDQRLCRVKDKVYPSLCWLTTYTGQMINAIFVPINKSVSQKWDSNLRQQSWTRTLLLKASAVDYSTILTADIAQSHGKHDCAQKWKKICIGGGRLSDTSTISFFFFLNMFSPCSYTKMKVCLWVL